MNQEIQRAPGQTFILFLSGLTSILLYAHVNCAMWHWFVASKFGLPEFTPLQMLGFTITVRSLVIAIDRDKKHTKRPFATEILWDVLAPMFLLLVGAVIHHFAVRFP